ncbi:MAG: phosphatidate cytidylyltransferase [Syntrophothermus sp.]
MNNFWMRTITGFSMVFLIIFLMYLRPMAFAALFLVITILGLLEFYSLTTSETVKPQKWMGVICGVILYLVYSLALLTDRLENNITGFLMLPLVLFFLMFVSEIFRKHPNPIGNLAYTIFGILYIALPFSLLMIMAKLDNNRDLFGFPSYLFGYFLLTWTYDTGAYLAGISFGKHKFFERISPKKTWEGTIGGIVKAAALTYFLIILVPGINPRHWIVLAFIVVVFGTLGDLAESLFKRSLAVKDSGKLLPGHGGILDRFDTVLLSAPFVFLYFIFFIRIFA